MVNKSKAKGTAAETRVVNFLLAAGVQAERVVMKGAKDQGDIHLRGEHGHVTAILEVKGGQQTQKVSRGTRMGWLMETEVETLNAGNVQGYLVIAQHGSSVCDYHVWSMNGHLFWYLDEFAEFVKGRF